MSTLRTLAVLLGVALSSLPAIRAGQADDGMMTCAAYLASPVEGRDRIAGSFLWAYLQKQVAVSGISPDRAGTVIAMLPLIRKGLDDGCKEKGGLVGPHAVTELSIMNSALSQGSVQ